MCSWTTVYCIVLVGWRRWREVESVYYCSDTSRSAVVQSYSSDREGFHFAGLTTPDHRQPPRWGTTGPWAVLPGSMSQVQLSISLLTEIFQSLMWKYFRFWWQRQWGRAGQCWEGRDETAGSLWQGKKRPSLFWCHLRDRWDLSYLNLLELIMK